MDKDQIVAASGALKKDIINKGISNNLLKIINERAMYVNSNASRAVNILGNERDEAAYQQIIQPIIRDGEAVGAVIMLLTERMVITEVEKKLLNVASLFIANQIR